MRTKIILTVLSGLFLLLFVSEASASVEKLYEYPVESLFQSSYRFLTLNKGFKVSEENPEMGLIIFTYAGRNAKKDKAASIEIIKGAVGPGTNKVRMKVPSLSDGTVSLILDELDKKIKADFKEAGIGEKIFHYPYESLYSSVYRYLVVDRNLKVKKADKDKGVIVFKPEKIHKLDSAYCEIFEMPRGGHKVRLRIATLTGHSLSVYLSGIENKIKKDYGD